MSTTDVWGGDIRLVVQESKVVLWVFFLPTHHLGHDFKFASALYFQQTVFFFFVFFVHSVHSSMYLKLHIYPNTQAHIENIFLSPLYCCIQHIFFFIYICLVFMGVCLVQGVAFQKGLDFCWFSSS